MSENKKKMEQVAQKGKKKIFMDRGQGHKQLHIWRQPVIEQEVGLNLTGHDPITLSLQNTPSCLSGQQRMSPSASVVSSMPCSALYSLEKATSSTEICRSVLFWLSWILKLES